MIIPITTAALALLTIAMLLLRIFWSRMPSRLRSFLIWASIAMILVHTFSFLTHWEIASERLNAVIGWAAIGGYELLVFLFSRLPPRWLTTACSVILVIPVFASSILLPLTSLFTPAVKSNSAIANHLVYEIVPWNESQPGKSGDDIFIYYRPPFAPLFRHMIQRNNFTRQECNADETVVTLGPRPKTVLFHCPALPSKPEGVPDEVEELP